MSRYFCRIHLNLYHIAKDKKIAEKHFTSMLEDIMKSSPNISAGTIHEIQRQYKKYTGKKASKELGKLRESLVNN